MNAETEEQGRRVPIPRFLLGADALKAVLVGVLVSGVLFGGGGFVRMLVYDADPSGGMPGRMSRQEDRYDQLARRVEALEKTRDEERRALQGSLQVMGERISRMEAQLESQSRLLEAMARTLGARGETLR